MDKMNSKQAYQRANALYQQRRFDEALAILTELANVYPDEKNPMYARALCLAALGRSEEAQRLCTKLTALYSDPRAATLAAKLQKMARTSPPIINSGESQIHGMGVTAQPRLKKPRKAESRRKLLAAVAVAVAVAAMAGIAIGIAVWTSPEPSPLVGSWYYKVDSDLVETLEIYGKPVAKLILTFRDNGYFTETAVFTDERDLSSEGTFTVETKKSEDGSTSLHVSLSGGSGLFLGRPVVLASGNTRIIIIIMDSVVFIFVPIDSEYARAAPGLV